MLRAYERCLSRAGYAVTCAAEGAAAVEVLDAGTFDAVISDISMPGMDGLQLLREVRSRSLDLPVVLMTAGPTVDSAIQAVEYGALQYLVKPVDLSALRATAERAVRLRRMAMLKREFQALQGAQGIQVADRAGLEAGFVRALSQLWMAFQPIVSWSRGDVFAYEALMRSEEWTMSSPGAVLEAAERLGALDRLGSAVRGLVAQRIADVPAPTQIFVNLHPRELGSPHLLARECPLFEHADRVVLEVTERVALEDIAGLKPSLARLRSFGYRLAVDDLGAGYSGLSTFAQLEPEVVKIDMSLVRNIHREPTKQKVVRSMIALCGDLGCRVVAEGIELPEERDVLVECGADLLQGYLFGRPARAIDRRGK
ncbi:MAG: EAL domain-containing protein [Deltaproteobacteria bacterium]|nr:EAL domain-containing protein [Deltaproteobacteria bacterium]